MQTVTRHARKANQVIGLIGTKNARVDSVSFVFPFFVRVGTGLDPNPGSIRLHRHGRALFIIIFAINNSTPIFFTHPRNKTKESVFDSYPLLFPTSAVY